MKRFYSYRDMKCDLRRLAQSYPEVLRVFLLSGTADRNRIYGILLGNRRAQSRVVIQASMHAREWLNTELVMRMVERSCRQWKKNAFYQGVSYRRLLEKVCFFIIPMVNPDGVAICQRGLRGIREEALREVVREAGAKELRHWKANARGVDLNRNYSTGFAAQTRQEQGSQEYAGKRPFSERETRALVKLILSVHPQAVVNYHSTGHLIYYREEGPLVRRMKKETGYRLCKETGGANGNLGDWLSELGIEWCTVETCVGKAPVSRKQLFTEWRKHRNIIAELAKGYFPAE